MLRRAQAGGIVAAEALAEFLAVDLVDSGSIPKFRTIARGVREGLVDPRTVRAGYKACKRPGVNNPGRVALVVRRGTISWARSSARCAAVTCAGLVELGQVVAGRRRRGIGFNGGRGGDLAVTPGSSGPSVGRRPGQGGQARAPGPDGRGRARMAISH